MIKRTPAPKSKNAPRTAGRRPTSAKGDGQIKLTVRGALEPKSGKKASKKSATKKRVLAGGLSSTEGTVDVARQRLAREAAVGAIDAALDKKALVPVLIDVSGRASYTDFIGVVSGRSDRQVDAIAEGVSNAMKSKGWYLLGREGASNGRWTLLDFGDVVVHVFYHPVREIYDIEGLWIDAPRIKLDVPPEANHVPPDALYGA